MPELVQGRAAGGLGEQRLGLLVAETGVPMLVQVGVPVRRHLARVHVTRGKVTGGNFRPRARQSAFAS